MKQVEQLSKMLRIEKERNLENEEENRKQIEEIKRLQDERIKIMKEEFDVRLQAQIESNPIQSVAPRHEQKTETKSKTEKAITSENFEVQ